MSSSPTPPCPTTPPPTLSIYLQDDCLRLRVKTVAVYSTPLLLKTPAWQDPLTASQSLCEFTVTEFSKCKQFNNRHYGPPFYTYPQGYKMYLQVYPNGIGSGKGTHVSVGACLMRGGYDDQLQWPFEGEVIFQLLNWRENKGHEEYTVDFSGYLNSTICDRVTDRHIGNGLGIHQLIPHSSLSYNPTTNTEYLQYDCLRQRVKTVTVHSK